MGAIKNQAIWEKSFPQFFQSGESITPHLMEAAQLVNLPAKQQVFYPGSRCENYLLMVEGGVKTQLLSESGREVLLYHVGPGDSCVLTTSCLLSGDNYPAEGVTEVDITAFAISSHAFHRGIEQSAFFREFVFKNFATRLSNIIKRIESLVFSTIDVRLSLLLLSMGVPVLHKTHQELAAELGTAREVISRHLKRFEAYGWIKITRGAIEIINPLALQALVKNSHE